MLRSVGFPCLLAMSLAASLAASPLAAQPQTLPISLVERSLLSQPALRLPGRVSFIPGSRRGHFLPRSSQLSRLDMAIVRQGRSGPSPDQLSPTASPHLPHLLRQNSASKPIEQNKIFPGLPSALIAVVEENPPGRTTSSAGKTVNLAQSDAVSAVDASSPYSGPVSLTATILNGPEASMRGLFFPVEAMVGAAAFSRGDDVLVVFDAARPFDLSAVQDDPAGARSSIQLLPEATVLRLRARHAADVTLRRVAAGWLIQDRRLNEPVKVISSVMDGGMLRLSVDNAGRTVVVPDAQTGGNLLVGTIRDGRQAVNIRRRESDEIIEQTIQGVVVDPLSDRLELRAATNAFLLSGIGIEAMDTGHVTAEPRSGSGNSMRRILSLAAGSPKVLYHRFKQAKAVAAAAFVGARFEPRLLAAEDALALGDADEAATIARVAVVDDAREATKPRPQLILAAASLLAHEPSTTDLLDDPEAEAGGEIALWRAVKLAERNPASPEAARLFAATLPLLQTYPAPLQKVLLPLAGESLARGGSDAQAALIERLPTERAFAFARAMLAERHGQHQVALAALDHLTLDRDARLAEMAAEEAITLRQSLPASDPAKLADALEGHLLDARIAGHDLATRFHLADLHTQAGQWQKALELLRETAVLYPEQQAEARRRVGQALKRLATAPTVSGDAEALAQATMIENNADMLPDGVDGTRISLFLAARLSALDLPERAAPIVQAMMHAARPGSEKAALGLHLAVLDFQQNDLAGVQAALQESDPGDLPEAIATPRLIMMARSLAGSRQLDQALAVLAPLKTDAALDLRAVLLARRGDWGGSSDALLALVRQDQPQAGKVDANGQDLLLRLASAASRSGDKDRIKQAVDIGNGRFVNPGKEALFHLLASDPMADEADPAKGSSEVINLHHASAIFNAISK